MKFFCKTIQHIKYKESASRIENVKIALRKETASSLISHILTSIDFMMISDGIHETIPQITFLLKYID